MGRILLNGLLAVFFKALSQQLAQRRMLSNWGVYRLIRVRRLVNPLENLCGVSGEALGLL